MNITFKQLLHLHQSAHAPRHCGETFRIPVSVPPRVAFLDDEDVLPFYWPTLDLVAEPHPNGLRWVAKNVNVVL